MSRKKYRGDDVMENSTRNFGLNQRHRKTNEKKYYRKRDENYQHEV